MLGEHSFLSATLLRAVQMLIAVQWQRIQPCCDIFGFFYLKKNNNSQFLKSYSTSQITCFHSHTSLPVPAYWNCAPLDPLSLGFCPGDRGCLAVWGSWRISPIPSSGWWLAGAWRWGWNGARTSLFCSFPWCGPLPTEAHRTLVSSLTSE